VSELLRFSKLFNDELTLDNLERYALMYRLHRCIVLPCATWRHEQPIPVELMCTSCRRTSNFVVLDWLCPVRLSFA
jgi:hypothetical protein